MNIWLEILKYTLPSAVMLVTVVIMMKIFFKQEENKFRFEQYKQNNNIVLPIRLRAYERLAIFLQRTTPESMLTRLDFSGLTVVQLQQMLHKVVRDEFEHNVSQQIYVSPQTWNLVVEARESIIKLINITASQLAPDISAMTLAQTLIATYAASNNPPTETALEFITHEVGKFSA